jgi:hypothetical protein
MSHHHNRAFGVGVHSNKVYLLDPDVAGGYKQLTTTIALDLDIENNGFGPFPGADPHYLRITADSTKAFLSLAAVGKVLYLDISDPTAIKIKQV